MLAVILLLVKGARGFGGGLRRPRSAARDPAVGAAGAGAHLFHTQFVVGALLGVNTGWRSPQRGDTETGWLDALRRHGLHSLLGIAWAGFVYWLNLRSCGGCCRWPGRWRCRSRYRYIPAG